MPQLNILYFTKLLNVNITTLLIVLLLINNITIPTIIQLKLSKVFMIYTW